MKRVSAQSVGEIIDGFLRQERLDSKLKEHRAAALWPELVGPGINRYTVNRTVKNGVMTVVLSSASLRNEMMLSRSVLKQRINEALGEEVIKEIQFR